MAQYFVRFIANLDPNPSTHKNGCVQWPPFNTMFRWQLEFTDDADQPTQITMDTYRLQSMLEVSKLSLQYPF